MTNKITEGMAWGMLEALQKLALDCVGANNDGPASDDDKQALASEMWMLQIICLGGEPRVNDSKRAIARIARSVGEIYLRSFPHEEE